MPLNKNLKYNAANIEIFFIFKNDECFIIAIIFKALLITTIIL
jgi:hypothetical protein